MELKPESVISSRRLTQPFAAPKRFLQSIVFADTTLAQKKPCDNKPLRHASALKSRIQVKGPIAAVLMALLCLSLGPVQASPLTQMAALEADSWRVRMGFHLLSIRGDAPEDRDALNELLNKGQQRIDTLAEVREQRPLAQQLQQHWQVMTERALDNPLASMGYADYAAMSEMNVQTLAMVALLEEARGAQQEAGLDVLVFSTALQKLASEYLALAAFPSAGLPTGTGLEPFDFLQQAAQLDQQLRRLEQHYQNRAEIADELSFVRQRWEFIRTVVPRINQPGADRVPYLFYRYSNQMAERLESLAASL